MLAAVGKVLENPPTTQVLAAAVKNSAQRWSFSFGRFLLGMGFLSTDKVNRLPVPLQITDDPVVLSLPETIERRRIFERENRLTCTLFDGVRCKPGWIGCGLSYQTLANTALNQGCETLTVMEDDVVLPDDFEEKLTIINEFLDEKTGQWDVFAGVIADLHPGTNILSVEEVEGITFVTIDRMTSMVFNIYTRKVLEILTHWDAEDCNDQTNTIDRFLESQANLRVVVTLPFLVGHREEVHSTLWGFQNTRYLDMIAKSENTLKQMIADLC